MKSHIEVSWQDHVNAEALRCAADLGETFRGRLRGIIPRLPSTSNDYKIVAYNIFFDALIGLTVKTILDLAKDSDIAKMEEAVICGVRQKFTQYIKAQLGDERTNGETKIN